MLYSFSQRGVPRGVPSGGLEDSSEAEEGGPAEAVPLPRGGAGEAHHFLLFVTFFVGQASSLFSVYFFFHVFFLYAGEALRHAFLFFHHVLYRAVTLFIFCMFLLFKFYFVC